MTLNIPKEATFPVSVYIAIICASSSGSTSCGVWDEGEQTFTAGEWEGRGGKKEDILLSRCVGNRGDKFEHELNSLVFHSLGRK